MNDIIGRLRQLSVAPAAKTEQFSVWLQQADVFAFLTDHVNSDELVLYAGLDHVYLYSVLVPSSEVPSLLSDDPVAWQCTPYSSWSVTYGFQEPAQIAIEPPLSSCGLNALSKGEQLLFGRSFEGKLAEKSYFELLQKFAHTAGIHYVSERSAYCRLDEYGDLEDVVRILMPREGESGGGIVVARRDVLDEYMAITNGACVTFFDSKRYDGNSVGSWEGKREEESVARENEELFGRFVRYANASSVRGFQLIRPRITREALFNKGPFKAAEERPYATFIAHDWKHSQVREISCDPEQLGNYFVESDLPFETSPAFFRPDVLQKYKADTSKYRVDDRSISCRGAWHLETYDVNEAGQIHTYVIYLSRLPYQEQLYWKAFNEPPKAPISKRAFKTDFEGRFDEDYDPLQSLRDVLRELQSSKVPWWTLRSPDLPELVHYPVTTSPDEWANELMALDKLVVEGLVTDELRTQAENLGRTLDKMWGSLKLLEEIVVGLAVDPDEAKAIVRPLREVHHLRNLRGHASGEEAKQIRVEALRKHKSYGAHFRHVCTECDAAVRTIREVLDTRIYKKPTTGGSPNQTP